MNVMFLVNGRWFKTLCKTVLEADTFDVSISSEKHNIHACISDKCYFLSIDNYSFENDETIKTDFYIKRDYKNIKEFTAKLEDCFSTFINISITDKHFCGNIDECISKILDDIKEFKRETAETETKRKKRRPITTDIDMKEEFTKEKAIAKAKLNSAYGITTESVTTHKFSDIEFESFKRRLKCLPPCDFPCDIVLTQITDEMAEMQLQDYCKILLDKGLAQYHRGEIVTSKRGYTLYTPTHKYEIRVFKDGAFSFSNEFSLESFAHNAFKMIENSAIDFPEHCFTVIQLFKDGKPVKRTIINFDEKLV